jgi:hypothetical protein
MDKGTAKRGAGAVSTLRRGREGGRKEEGNDDRMEKRWRSPAKRTEMIVSYQI